MRCLYFLGWRQIDAVELARADSRRRDRLTADMVDRHCQALGIRPLDERFYGHRACLVTNAKHRRDGPGGEPRLGPGEHGPPAFPLIARSRGYGPFRTLQKPTGGTSRTGDRYHKAACSFIHSASKMAHPAG